MASLTSTGLGSGLDIEGLVTKLMAVERLPLTKLAQQEASYQAKITAYGNLKGALSTFQTSVDALNTGTAFNTQKASVTDTSVASVAASESASIGSYSLEVDHLALAQKVKTAATYTATTDTVGSGTISIDFGTYSGPPTNTFSLNSKKSTQTITIPSGQNTLSGVRDAINAANAGVTASIVNDGSGYRLLLSSNDTGAANAMRIQTTGTLSALNYDATAALPSSMTQTQAALDAEFTMDGITFTKSSNTVTDALDGVTLTLLKANSGSPTTLSVIRDSTNVATLVKNFVSAYNTLKSGLSSMTAYDATTKTAGVLQGDSTALTVMSQLRSIFNTTLNNAGGGFTTLSDIGVSFKKDGTLSLDSTKLASALNDPTKDVASLFTAMGTPTDSLVNFTSSLGSTKPGNYAVNVTQLATQSVLTGASGGLSGSTLITAGSNDTLNLSVDGKAVSITLTAGTYTNAQLAAELQSKVNGKLGTSGSSIEVATSNSASSTGSIDVNATTYPFSPATGNDSFQIDVGGTVKTVSLAGGTYADSGELAAALEAKINALYGGSTANVTVDNDQLRVTARGAANVTLSADGSSTLFADIFGTPTTASGAELSVTSKNYGAASAVVISGGNAAATLFGGATQGSTAQNVAGTIGGVAATGFGQVLTATSGDPGGLQVKVIGGATGSRGTVQFDQGFAFKLTTAIDDITSTGGLISNRTDGIEKSIDDLGDQSEKLALRLTQIEARYRSQFNALDALIANMQQTSTFLEQQLSTLSSSKK